MSESQVQSFDSADGLGLDDDGHASPPPVIEVVSLRHQRLPPDTPVYFLLHTEYDRSYDADRVRMGFPDRKLQAPCVQFVVPKDTTLPVDIAWVGYNPGCASRQVPAGQGNDSADHGALPEGSGSAAMFCAALWVLQHRYPEHAKLQFMDSSKLHRCYGAVTPRTSPAPVHPSLRLEVSLAKHSILLYGQTWYTRLFRAHPVTSRYHPRNRPTPAQEMERVRALLQQEPERGEAAFERWYGAHLGEAAWPAARQRAWRWLQQDAKPLMRRAWLEAPASHLDFYKRVNQLCGCGVFHVLCQTALDAPVEDGGLGLRMGSWLWEIDMDDVRDDVQREVVEIQITAAAPEVAMAGGAYFDAVDRLRVWEDEQRPSLLWRDGPPLSLECDGITTADMQHRARARGNHRINGTQPGATGILTK